MSVNNGDFTRRTDYESGSGNYGVAVADLDGDGHVDIVTSNYREPSMSVLHGVGDGTFSTAVTTQNGLRSREGQWVPDDSN